MHLVLGEWLWQPPGLNHIEILKSNLITVINKSLCDSVDMNSSIPDVGLDMPLIVPKSRLDGEKDRLKTLLKVECDKIEVKVTKVKKVNTEPKHKKKKSSVMSSDESLHVVSNVDELVGKRVAHLITDYDKKYK